MGSLLRRAHFESLRAAEAKNSATINQLKYRSRSCITANIAYVLIINVAVYKDLNLEFVTKKCFVTRTQCKNTIKSYISHAYCLFYACIRNDFVSDGNRACRATCRVPGSTTNANRLCARASRQLPRPLDTKQRCIHLGSDSRRPFDAHLRIHYHLQLLTRPRLQLISASSVAVSP